MNPFNWRGQIYPMGFFYSFNFFFVKLCKELQNLIQEKIRDKIFHFRFYARLQKCKFFLFFKYTELKNKNMILSGHRNTPHPLSGYERQCFVFILPQKRCIYFFFFYILVGPLKGAGGYPDLCGPTTIKKTFFYVCLSLSPYRK